MRNPRARRSRVSSGRITSSTSPSSAATNRLVARARYSAASRARRPPGSGEHLTGGRDDRPAGPRGYPYSPSMTGSRTFDPKASDPRATAMVSPAVAEFKDPDWVNSLSVMLIVSRIR